MARRAAHSIKVSRNWSPNERPPAFNAGFRSEAAIDTVDADFTDLAGTRNAGLEIVERFERVDALINNAGVHTMSQRTTGDGLPEMVTVNYLAPWLLTGTVLPALRRAGHSRIITVASEASRRHGTLRIPDDLTDIRPFNALRSSPVYGKTKLLDIMFSLELAERLSGTAISAICLNPGYNTTGLGRELRFAATLERILHSVNIGNPRHGAGLIVRLATESGRESGAYYSGRTARRITPVAPANDPGARYKLWQATAELLSACGFTDIYSGAPV